MIPTGLNISLSTPSIKVSCSDLATPSTTLSDWCSLYLLLLLRADGRAPQGAALDSARQNLAATFVNAFVNAGFGQDKLVTAGSDAAQGSGDSGKALI